MFSQLWKTLTCVLGVLVVILLIVALLFRGSAAVANAGKDAAIGERDQARAEVDALRVTLEIERKRADAMTAIAQNYEDEKDAAAAESDRVIADLRAGNLRLRQLWQAQAATADLSEAVVRAAQPDEGARDREESAARIVRAADECDAQVRGLQRVIEADRRE
jgi:hypothetical protein